MAASEDIEQSLVDGLSSVLLSSNVDGLDDDLITYMAGMLSSREDADTEESIEEVLVPFLESVACPDALVEQSKQVVRGILESSTHENDVATTRKLQQGVVNMASQKTGEEASNLWSIEGGGENAVKAMANSLIDAHNEKTSAKDKRRARKAEAEKARKLLSSAQDRDTDMDDGVLVRMNVRNIRNVSDKKKDVLVRNVTVSLNNGTTLLEGGELKMAYQRRYGLIGENGVGMYERSIPLHCVFC